MSNTTPTLREEFTAAGGQIQRLVNALAALGFGDLLAALVRKAIGGSKIQSATFTATGSSQAVTFAGLGLVPPATANYQVFAACETTNARIDESTKTTTGFTILGTTNTEPINIAVVEDYGDGSEAVAVSSNAGTLAVQPSAILDVYATGGTTKGRYALKIGDSSVSPATGEVVWDGNTGLRFNSADAVSAVRVLSLPKASPLTISLLSRALGQRD